VISRYADPRGLHWYLAGAAAARAGDEMSGPALLLLGFAATGRPETGSGLLASLTIAGAAGGPLFGALLDRSRRPDRLLAWTLAAYALGIVAVQGAVGQLPMPGLTAIALLGWPDAWVLASTLVIGVSMAATALAPGWLTLAAVALGGAGEGPQLTALLAVRHRDTPANLRGQVFTTAASLKIAGLAAGAALAGPLAGWSVTGCLLIAAGIALGAAAAYLAAGFTRPGQRAPTAAAPPGRARTDPATDRPVRSG
jgi:MFS family permease